MSLDSWERRSLAALEESLSASAPELESLLAMFNRLTASEAMPSHAKIRWLPRGHRPRQPRRLPRARLLRRRRTRRLPRAPLYLRQRRSSVLERWWKAYLAIWVIFFVGLVATAVALSSAGPQA